MEILVASTEYIQELLDIYKYYVEETAITFEYDVPTYEDFHARIENTLKKYPYLIAKEGDEVLGYAYAGVFKGRAAYDWACELSIYVKKGKHKSGIGKALYNRLEEILKEMGMCNLYACIAAPIVEDQYLDNNSIDYHAHMGYELIGTFHQCGYKFNTWYDMVWMEKMINDHHANQKEIIWFNELNK